MNNVHPIGARSGFRYLSAEVSDHRASGSPADILPFNRLLRDEIVVRRCAGWMSEEIDPVDAWRRSLFMSRLAAQIDATMKASTISQISWQVQCPGWIKGAIVTPHGKVTAYLSSSHLDAHARFEGAQAALITSGIADQTVLNQGPRKTKTTAFGCERLVRVNRNKDHRELSFELTSEEYENIRALDIDSLASAKQAFNAQLAELPTSNEDYRERVARHIAVIAGMLTREAFDVAGGFSLSTASRAALMVQAEALKNIGRTAAVQFNQHERMNEISRLATKYAPSFARTAPLSS